MHLKIKLFIGIALSFSFMTIASEENPLATLTLGKAKFLGFNADGSKFICWKSNENASIGLICNTLSGDIIYSMEYTAKPIEKLVSKDAKWIIVSYKTPEGTYLDIQDFDNEAKKKSLAIDQRDFFKDLSPDGRYLMLGTSFSSKIWDFMQNKFVEFVPSKLIESAFNADGLVAFQSIEAQNQVTFFDLNQSRLFGAIQNTSVSSFIFTANDIFIRSSNGKTLTKHSIKPVSKKIFSVPDIAITSVTLSPDENWIATTSSEEEALFIQDATTGKIVATLKHEGVVKATSFSEDGLLMMVRGLFGTIYLYQFEDKKLLREIHAVGCDAARLSADKKYIFTCSARFPEHKKHIIEIWRTLPHFEEVMSYLKDHPQRANSSSSENAVTKILSNDHQVYESLFCMSSKLIPEDLQKIVLFLILSMKVKH